MIPKFQRIESVCIKIVIDTMLIVILCCNFVKNISDFQKLKEEFNDNKIVDRQDINFFLPLIESTINKFFKLRQNQQKTT